MQKNLKNSIKNTIKEIKIQNKIDESESILALVLPNSAMAFLSEQTLKEIEDKRKQLSEFKNKVGDNIFKEYIKRRIRKDEIAIYVNSKVPEVIYDNYLDFEKDFSSLIKTVVKKNTMYKTKKILLKAGLYLLPEIVTTDELLEKSYKSFERNLKTEYTKEGIERANMTVEDKIYIILNNYLLKAGYDSFDYAISKNVESFGTDSYLNGMHTKYIGRDLSISSNPGCDENSWYVYSKDENGNPEWKEKYYSIFDACIGLTIALESLHKDNINKEVINELRSLMLKLQSKYQQEDPKVRVRI